MAAKMISIGEALPKECCDKLEQFVEAYRGHKLIMEEGKTVCQLLLERVLRPYEGQLQACWDLDYLSYMLCYALKIEM